VNHAHHLPRRGGNACGTSVALPTKGRKTILDFSKDHYRAEPKGGESNGFPRCVFPPLAGRAEVTRIRPSAVHHHMEARSVQPAWGSDPAHFRPHAARLGVASGKTSYGLARVVQHQIVTSSTVSEPRVTPEEIKLVVWISLATKIYHHLHHYYYHHHHHLTRVSPDRVSRKIHPDDE